MLATQRRAAGRSPSALALLVLVAGCATNEPDPKAPRPATEAPAAQPAGRAQDGNEGNFLPGRLPDNRKPVTSSLQPDSLNEKQAVIVHWETLKGRWIQEKAAIDAGTRTDEPLLEWSLPGRYLDVRYVVVRGDADAPSKAPPPVIEKDIVTRGAPAVAPEVIIVMEGDRGIIEIEGRPTPVQVGTVCVLPAGARGKMHGAIDSPLQLLVIRAMPPRTEEGAAPEGVRAPAAHDGEPLVTSFDALWDGPMARAEKAAGPNEALEPVGSLAERLGIFAWHIRGFVPVRQHHERDLFFFVLHGNGTFGAATSGHVLLTGSLVFVPAGVTYYYSNMDDTGTRALALLGPGWDPKDVHLVAGPKPQRKGESRVQVEPPGSPKAEPRTPDGDGR